MRRGRKSSCTRWAGWIPRHPRRCGSSQRILHAPRRWCSVHGVQGLRCGWWMHRARHRRWPPLLAHPARAARGDAIALEGLAPGQWHRPGADGRCGFTQTSDSSARTSHAAHASTTDKGSDAQRVAALQQELNEVRKSQRALAAKLIKKGDSTGALSVERFVWVHQGGPGSSEVSTASGSPSPTVHTRRCRAVAEACASFREVVAPVGPPSRTARLGFWKSSLRCRYTAWASGGVKAHGL